MENTEKRESSARPPPDEAALKQQQRKKRKLDKANAMESGQWDRCLFKVVRKNRYCNNQRVAGTDFCGNHVPNDTTACSNRSQQFKPELRVRVPCPLDGSHSVYAFDLDKHVKVCNKLREATAAKNLPFYTENINSGTHVSETAPVVVESTAEVEDEADGEQGETTEHAEPTPREEQGLIDRLALLDFPGLVSRVHAAYDKCVGDIPLQKRLHPCCDVLLAEKTAAGSSKNVLRHIEQQASILGNMDDVQLLDTSAAFLELGAGRGMLSLALAQALPDNLYVLIDRAGGRGKADHIIRDAAKAQKEPRVKRAKIDIRHLNLAGMQELNDTPAVVGMSKHLCGVATDLSLRSLHTLPRRATDTDGRLSSRLKGLAVALCCHHVCRWEDYVSPEFFIAQGFSAPEFALLCAMTSWATCAMGISGDSVEHVLGISQADRAVLGRKCKRIIDAGRVDFLRSLGLEAKLVHYCDVEESVENCLLLAWTPPAPRSA